jgi:hypothetical protein
MGLSPFTPSGPSDREAALSGQEVNTMGTREIPHGWPKLRKILNPIAPQITYLNVRTAMYGHKAILRFSNDYGVEIYKHPNNDFFEMSVIKFRGVSYEFAFDTPIPDLNLGYNDEDVLRLCNDVSRLK